MLLKVSLLEGGPRGGGVTSKARLELETRWMESVNLVLVSVARVSTFFSSMLQASR